MEMGDHCKTLWCLAADIAMSSMMVCRIRINRSSSNDSSGLDCALRIVHIFEVVKYRTDEV